MSPLLFSCILHFLAFLLYLLNLKLENKCLQIFVYVFIEVFMPYRVLNFRLTYHHVCTVLHTCAVSVLVLSW